VVFEESTEIGFNSRTKKVKIPKKLKPLKIIKLYEESAPLTPEEQSIINSMDGVNGSLANAIPDSSSIESRSSLNVYLITSMSMRAG
jgi:hypothetical protein